MGGGRLDEAQVKGGRRGGERRRRWRRRRRRKGKSGKGKKRRKKRTHGSMEEQPRKHSLAYIKVVCFGDLVVRW